MYGLKWPQPFKGIDALLEVIILKNAVVLLRAQGVSNGIPRNPWQEVKGEDCFFLRLDDCFDRCLLDNEIVRIPIPVVTVCLHQK
jgi:hypothetical protein